jgi:glutamate-5-semialdehyde dehydrogenase
MSIQSLIIKTYKAAIQLRRASDKQIKTTLKKLADALDENSRSLLKGMTG